MNSLNSDLQQQGFPPNNAKLTLCKDPQDREVLRSGGEPGPLYGARVHLIHSQATGRVTATLPKNGGPSPIPPSTLY